MTIRESASGTSCCSSLSSLLWGLKVPLSPFKVPARLAPPRAAGRVGYWVMVHAALPAVSDVERRLGRDASQASTSDAR
jgi:hypothetical protein